jgi:hypothetical protein
MADQERALRLAALIQGRHGNDINDEAAAELRRLHAENERLTNLCYEYTFQITALRAAEQMRTRIDAMKERSKT